MAVLTFIKFKSSDFVKSNFFSAAVAELLFMFPAFVFTTSTTDLRATSKASFSLAPAHSAAEANDFIAVVICLLILATANALVASTHPHMG